MLRLAPFSIPLWACSISEVAWRNPALFCGIRAEGTWPRPTQHSCAEWWYIPFHPPGVTAAGRTQGFR